MSNSNPLPDACAWRELLAAAGEARALCVAFSGGADSSALLHHLAGLRREIAGVRLRALHVDHRLHPDSAGWARQCERVGSALGVELGVLVVNASPAPGASPEAAAREARYGALARAMAAGEVLVTAHHADDQAETLLLQLLRGAGSRGLAAMPRLVRFGPGWLARPLLETTRTALLGYCEAHGLEWIDDPSNTDPSHDRSYLRTTVMPLLAGRWPGVVRALSRAAAHQAWCAELLAEVAREDLGEPDAAAVDALPLSLLHAQSPARRANTLRGWLRARGAPTPSTAQLAQMLDTMLAARADAEPEVRWGGVWLRRYALHLYLGEQAPPAGPPRTAWPDLRQPLQLRHGTLVATPAVGAGVRAASLRGGDVEVRLRRGGERLRPHGDRHTRELKKLLHASGTPPWRRAGLPLLYAGERLLAVPGLCVAEGHAAAPGEAGLVFSWRPAAGRRAGITDDD